MFAAAENLEFEKAARLRDELKALEQKSGKSSSVDPSSDEAATAGVGAKRIASPRHAPDKPAPAKRARGRYRRN